MTEMENGMKKILYLECYAGISGDMTVAALLDLGVDRNLIDRAVESIRPLVSGFDVVIKRVQKSGIDACDFDVVLDSAHENHDHDMAYLHGHNHGTRMTVHMTTDMSMRSIAMCMVTATMTMDRKHITIMCTGEWQR